MAFLFFLSSSAPVVWSDFGGAEHEQANPRASSLARRESSTCKTSCPSGASALPSAVSPSTVLKLTSWSTQQRRVQSRKRAIRLKLQGCQSGPAGGLHLCRAAACPYAYGATRRARPLGRLLSSRRLPPVPVPVAITIARHTAVSSHTGHHSSSATPDIPRHHSNLDISIFCPRPPPPPATLSQTRPRHVARQLSSG